MYSHGNLLDGQVGQFMVNDTLEMFDFLPDGSWRVDATPGHTGIIGASTVGIADSRIPLNNGQSRFGVSQLKSGYSHHLRKEFLFLARILLGKKLVSRLVKAPYMDCALDTSQ